MGAGKSTIADIFRKLGCGIFSADAINHEVLKKKDVQKQLIDHFGVGIANPEGGIDRQALGDMVFDNKDNMQYLTDLVHPVIGQYQARKIESCQNDPDIKAIVLDVPLLLETGQQDLCDTIVFIDTDESIRHNRLQENRGWSEDKIKKVEKLQFALDRKKKISEYTIDNNSGIPDSTSQVDEILNKVLQKYCQNVK